MVNVVIVVLSFCAAGCVVHTWITPQGWKCKAILN
jgi:hypothetical protein